MKNLKTEEEARARWCPLKVASFLSSPSNVTIPKSQLGCSASECMAWNWGPEVDKVGDGPAPIATIKYERGYCALTNTGVSK